MYCRRVHFLFDLSIVNFSSRKFSSLQLQWYIFVLEKHRREIDERKIKETVSFLAVRETSVEKHFTEEAENKNETQRYRSRQVRQLYMLWNSAKKTPNSQKLKTLQSCYMYIQDSSIASSSIISAYQIISTRFTRKKKGDIFVNYTFLSIFLFETLQFNYRFEIIYIDYNYRIVQNICYSSKLCYYYN